MCCKHTQRVLLCSLHLHQPKGSLHDLPKSWWTRSPGVICYKTSSKHSIEDTGLISDAYPSALLCRTQAPPSRCTQWLQEELEALFLQIDKAHGPPSGFILKAELLQALKSYFRVGEPGYKTDIRFEELKEVGALQDPACSLGRAAHASFAFKASLLCCSDISYATTGAHEGLQWQDSGAWQPASAALNANYPRANSAGSLPLSWLLHKVLARRQASVTTFGRMVCLSHVVDSRQILDEESSRSGPNNFSVSRLGGSGHVSESPGIVLQD